MSTHLRSLLDEILDAEAPGLDAVGAPERLVRVHARARSLRRRRTGAPAAAALLAAAVLAVVRVPPERADELVAPPAAPAAVLPADFGGRTRLAAVAAQVDGPLADVVVVPTTSHLGVLVRCTGQVASHVTVDVGVAGDPAVSVPGCGAHVPAEYSAWRGEFGSPHGLRPGVPVALSVHVSSGGGDDLDDAFVYIGVYAVPAGPPPRQQPRVRVTSG